MADRLLPWAFGAFHTTLLLGVVLAALQWTSGIRTALEAVGTEAGVAAFVLLWGLSWLGAARTLRDVDFTQPADFPALAGRAALWAGVTGGVFVGVVSLTLVLLRSAGAAGFFIAFLGGALGFVAGVVVGLFLTLVDAALLAGVQLAGA